MTKKRVNKKSNGGYGINVEGYTYYSVKDCFDGNVSGTIHADGSDAEIHEY